MSEIKKELDEFKRKIENVNDLIEVITISNNQMSNFKEKIDQLDVLVEETKSHYNQMVEKMLQSSNLKFSELMQNQINSSIDIKNNLTTLKTNLQDYSNENSKSFEYLMLSNTNLIKEMNSNYEFLVQKLVKNVNAGNSEVKDNLSKIEKSNEKALALSTKEIQNNLKQNMESIQKLAISQNVNTKDMDRLHFNRQIC